MPFYGIYSYSFCLWEKDKKGAPFKVLEIELHDIEIKILSQHKGTKERKKERKKEQYTLCVQAHSNFIDLQKLLFCHGVRLATSL